MAQCNLRTYLYHNPRSSHYFFRIRIPLFMRSLVLRKELRYSLRTPILLEAEYRAIFLARGLKRLFAVFARKWTQIMKEMTQEEIDYLVSQYMIDLIKYFEDNRVLQEGSRGQAEYDWSLSLLDKYIEEAQKELILNDYKPSSMGFDDLLSGLGFEEIDKIGYAYKKMRREFLKARIEVLKVEKKRELGDYSDNLEEELTKKLQLMEALKSIHPVQSSYQEPFSVQDKSESPPDKSHLPETGGELLSDIIKKFVEERRRAGVWRPKTEVEVMTSLSLLQEVLGDVPVSAISHATMRTFKETLLKLPPNLRKKPDYRDKSIDEIVNMNISEYMNTSTINKQLDRASTLFKWAVRNGYMDRNPAEGMQIPAKKREDEYRSTFNKNDLALIFSSHEYLEDTHKYPHRFWLPVIGLYTGMRLNEICQLQLDDIHEDEAGVYVFEIRQKKGITGTKNAPSERLVPIHDFLRVDLNLPGFVNKLREEGKSRLFPELKKGRDGYGQKASRWFGRYREKCGIVDGPDGKKDFHSFRHTVSNTLKQANAEYFPTQELIGHSTGSITFGRYGKRYSPKFLKEHVVDLLKYDVDLSHLKQSKFVVK